MSNFDLLSAAVQPEGGWFAIVGITKGKPSWQVLVDTQEKANAAITRMLTARRDVYFGVAKFGDPKLCPPDTEGKVRPRGQINVVALKSLWVDLDVGPNKPYESKAAAATDLQRFLDETALPMPTIVDSGGGIHVYWALDEEVSREQWEPMCAWLKALCVQHGLGADPTCFEAARILRVPDTANTKFKPVRVVTIKHIGSPSPLATFGTAPVTAPARKASAVPGAGRGLSPLAQSVEDARDAMFDNVVTFCQQMRYAYEHQEEASEPLWRAALSVANRCIDADTAVHRVSDQHSAYDQAETDKKAAATKGPQSCKQFDAHNPGGCKGCPYEGLITSPIELGKTEEPDEVEVDDFGTVQIPFPYYRDKKQGGIYRKPPKGVEEAPAKIYDFDLLVLHRMVDPEGNYSVAVRVRTPVDGVVDFTVPIASVMDVKKLTPCLAAKSVSGSPKDFTNIAAYFVSAVTHLNKTKKATVMRNQFGWADNHRKFVIGHREITPSGTVRSHISSGLKKLADMMEPVGSYKKWQEVMNLYAKPGMEPFAFAAATAFGAPLMHLSGLRGAIINLIHPKSGTGKTTAQRMANSVWGHPEDLNAMDNDTTNSKFQIMGQFGSLSVCFDEMSNTKAEALSTFIYTATYGHGKERMKGDTNELRVNTTEWRTLVLCSSNHSFYDKLETIKAAPEGEVMRVLEYSIPPSTKMNATLAREMFDHQLMKNYGHAGDRYAQYLIDNAEAVVEVYRKIEKRIADKLGLLAPERFWSAAAASNLAGIYIANAAKIIDWDFSAVFNWACGMIQDLRKTAMPPKTGSFDILSGFLMDNIDCILQINSVADMRNKMVPLPTMEPKRELKIRHEPDTGKLFMRADSFKQYCAVYKAEYRNIIRQFKDCGLLIDIVPMRIARGTELKVPVTRTIILDTNNSDFNGGEFLADDSPSNVVPIGIAHSPAPEVAREAAAAAAFEAEMSDASGGD